MDDIILESARTIVLLGIVIYLWKAGKARAQAGQKGWRFIMAGFLLLAVGSAVDITDNFEALNRFFIIGNTKTEAFLEKMIGFLGGFVVLAIGLVRWIPTVANVHKIESLVEELQRHEREHNQAEEALRQSEHRYHELVNRMRSGVTVFKAVDDGDDFVFVDFNQGAEAIEHLRRDDVIGERLTKVFPGVSEFGLLEVFQRVWRTGNPEHHPVTLYKDERVTGWRENFVYRLPSGEVVAVYDDLTSQKQATEALREREETIRALVETSRDWIWSIDVDGVHTYSNPVIEEILGYRPDELLGRQSLDLMHEDDRALIEARLPVCVAERGGWNNLLIRWRHKNSGYRHLESNAVPILDAQGKLVGFRGVDRDVTERMRAEEEQKRLEEQLRQAQKMEAVGQLAGGMAHEFNNMLAVIMWSAEFLQTSLGKDLSVEAESQASLEQIIKAGRRASDLTHQLLTLGRKQVVRPGLLDLSALVGDAVKMLERLVGERIRLQTALDDAVKPVWADGGQIGQVLINLVLNARDAMPAGGLITIETANVGLDEPYAASHVDAHAGPHVRLSVTDAGCGMDAETRRRVFEPFFTTKPVGKGSGLGLAVVFGIVKQAGGHIAVDSQPGQGTTVNVLLPATAAGAATADQEQTVAELATAGSQTILVCEDETMVRDPLCRMLRASGFTVIEAENGKHALEVTAAHEGPVDALITDVVMPEMQGPELAKALKEQHPELRVMYISGYAPGELKLEDGAKFVEKPCMPSTMLQHLLSLLNT